jgi:thymidylate kinase
MKGLVVLDGPDSVGKTTLAKAIEARHPGTKYIHMTYIKDDRSMFLANYRALLSAQSWIERGFLVVMDRGWISENIYAGIYRGGSGLAHDVAGLDRVVMRLAGIYVICCPKVDECVRRHGVCHSMGREMYEPDERIGQVAQRYRDVYEGLHECMQLKADRHVFEDYVQRLIDMGGMRIRPDTVSYEVNLEGDNLPKIIDGIEHLLELRQCFQHPFGLSRQTRNYVGHIAYAKWMFVGDRCNPNKGGHWPFVDYGASSRTMTKILHQLKFDETQAIWTNANDEWLVEELLDAKPSLQVVALGNSASRTLADHGITHECVYHPSFVGRFGRHEEFTSQLQNILND